MMGVNRHFLDLLFLYKLTAIVTNVEILCFIIPSLLRPICSIVSEQVQVPRSLEMK